MRRCVYFRGACAIGAVLFLVLQLQLQAQTAGPDLPDAPLSRHTHSFGVPEEVSPVLRGHRMKEALPLGGPPLSGSKSRTEASGVSSEPFHWKGLLLQSFAFQSMENGVRIMTADQRDRHNLLDKPFWANYRNSLGQFNMGRWNDGDDFMVNYVGHPVQGAITGYLEVQNDPRGRALKLSNTREYWHSRLRAMLWANAYSVQSEIGPFGEAGVLSEGGYTYPIRCGGSPGASNSCDSPRATFTNNTGWVDFIITPVVGTVTLIGGDAIDRYITDPLVAKHPGSIKYQILRGSLNPPRSLANMLRGEYPWYRDYDHPEVYESQVVKRFERSLDAEPVEHGEFGVFYSSLAVGANRIGCSDCRMTTSGLGAEVGMRVLPYLDLVASVENQPGISPLPSTKTGGSLAVATFGLRSGYSTKHVALRLALKPGFATWSHVLPESAGRPDHRTSNFAAAAEASGDARINKHLALRVTVEQLLIRYRSPITDPPGIGTPPDLSFLSHENFINSTNWGVRVGPVVRW